MKPLIHKKNPAEISTGFQTLTLTMSNMNLIVYCIPHSFVEL